MSNSGAMKGMAQTPTQREEWKPRSWRSRCVYFVIAIALSCLTSTGGLSVAVADEPPSYLPTLQDYQEGEQGISIGPSSEALPTDLEAAEELPHRDLGRSEALELLERTFGPQLQIPAGIFDELDVQKFLSDNAVVIGAGDQPDQLDGSQATTKEPTLLDSTIPLRTQNQLGVEEPVDLSLSGADGELQVVNPLTDLNLPSTLGEGIELPGSGIRVKLVDAPSQLTPSVVADSVAAYPNVADDTDLAIAPTPSGFETLTQIRSADAPRSQTFQLELPPDASLEASPDGGAVVVSGDSIILITPPNAIDASGERVPSALEVSGDSFTLTVSPGPDTVYPILLDPLVQEYTWGNGWFAGIEDWRVEGNASFPYATATSAQCGSWCAGYLAPNSPGLWIMAAATWPNGPNWQKGWYYYVPRWDADWKSVNRGPTSYITQATYYSMSFQHRSDPNISPYLVGGLWWPEGNQFKSSLWRGGNEPNASLDLTWSFPGGNIAKLAVFALVSSDEHRLTANRDAWLGWTTIELSDPEHPKPGAAGTTPKWVNNSPASPIPFEFVDDGLGVYSIIASDKSGHSWTTKAGCTGTAGSPCPRIWGSQISGQPAISYDPSVMPQGINTVELVASDPVAHASNQALNGQSAEPANAKVKVDHTAPTIAFSGSMTEQATLGTSRPSYTLKWVSKDGTTESPQSGATSTELLVDGKVVSSSAPGCTTQNCEISKEWTLDATAYAEGNHTVMAKTTDGVGLKTQKSLVLTISKDTTAPILNPTAALYVAPEGWVEQKSYDYNTTATDPKGYGVTSLVLKLDGNIVKSVTQTCPTGACSKAFGTSTINMASYTGGEHQAELLATDGAGNVGKKVWTVNVDPKGVVAAGEATDTLEAVEETAEELAPVEPTGEALEPGQIEGGDNPGLKVSGSEISSTGVPDSTSIVPATGTVTVEGPDGAIELTPVGGGSSAETKISSGVAAVTPATATGVDTVARPQYNGSMLFEAIREPTSPESFTWQVKMEPDQYLKLKDEQHAEVDYSDGTMAFLISAEIAHDATGAPVPTNLKVSGSNLTLVVQHHSASYVYPILAGQAYETSYVPGIVLEEPAGEETEEAAEAPPPPSPPISPQQAKWLVKPRMGGHTDVEAPPYPPAGLASASKIREFIVDEQHVCQIDHCDIWRVYIADGSAAQRPHFLRGFNWSEWIPYTKLHCGGDAGDAYEWTIGLEINGQGCGFAEPPWKVWKGEGKHLTIWSRHKISVPLVTDLVQTVETEYLALKVWIWPNGYQEKVIGHYDPGGPLEN